MDNKNIALSGENELAITNLKMEDTSVIQCNATNKHGYIFANAYLKVGGKSRLFFLHFATVIICWKWQSLHSIKFFSFCREANFKGEFSTGQPVILDWLGYFPTDFITISVITFDT